MFLICILCNFFFFCNYCPDWIVGFILDCIICLLVYQNVYFTLIKKGVVPVQKAHSFVGFGKKSDWQTLPLKFEMNLNHAFVISVSLKLDCNIFIRRLELSALLFDDVAWNSLPVWWLCVNLITQILKWYFYWEKKICSV